MKAKINRKWNRDVERQIKNFAPAKKWLARWINDKDTDWESQKSAHQALKLLEMVEFEIWNMQWWKSPKERALYLKAENNVNGR